MAKTDTTGGWGGSEGVVFFGRNFSCLSFLPEYLPKVGGLNPCPIGQWRQLWHLKLMQKVAQSARLSMGGEGGAKAIWAMPKCLRDNLNGASLNTLLLFKLQNASQKKVKEYFPTYIG